MSTNSMSMSQFPGGIHIERFRLHIARMIRFSVSKDEDADQRAADAFNLARQDAWRASEEGSHDALIEIIERELSTAENRGPTRPGFPTEVSTSF